MRLAVDLCGWYNADVTYPDDFTLNIIPQTVFDRWENEGVRSDSYARVIINSGIYPKGTELSRRTGSNIRIYAVSLRTLRFGLPPSGLNTSTNGVSNYCYGEWHKAMLTRRHQDQVKKGSSDE